MDYAAPGVRIQHVEARSVGRVRTDVAGFVGVAERGPLLEPVRVASWTEYRAAFGGYVDQGFLAYAVDGFFANGGSLCYVSRVAGPSAGRARLALPDESGQTSLALVAKSPGRWGGRVAVTVFRLGGDVFSLSVEAPDGAPEFWPNLTLETAAAALNAARTGSSLIAVDPAGRNPQAGPPAATRAMLGPEGADGLGDLGYAEFAAAIDALGEVDEVALLAVPDLAVLLEARRYLPPAGPSCADLSKDRPVAPVLPEDLTQRPALSSAERNALLNQLVAQCEARRNRIALLDPSRDTLSPAEVLAEREAFDTTYAALYYPWLCVPDLRPGRPPAALRRVPPCGHVAGIYARLERERGVAKPPANAEIAQANDVTQPLDAATHGYLNQRQVNALRETPGRGLRVAGSRLLTRDTPWMFVNVRRLFIMMERSLDRAMQWTVFEPGNPTLWLEIERSARTFVDGLWRQGLLDGQTPAEAYRVTCDATTNPPELTGQGRVLCEIRVLPPGCIEQVVVTLVRTDTGAALVQEARA